MSTLTHIRCWQCGQVIPVNEAVRKNVTAGYITDSGSINQRVDWCRACVEAEQKDANRRSQEFGQDARHLFVGFAIIFAAVATLFLGLVGLWVWVIVTH